MAAVVSATVLAVALSGGSSTSAEPPQAVRPGTHAVMFVGNNWEGTADIVDPTTFKRLGRINVVPDLEARMAEINSSPVRTGYFFAIRHLVGEGNDQYVDDMFSSHDGRFVYVSRPSLADVVAIDLKSHEIVWRVPMDGQRSDHMAISPDGNRVLVSDSTARKVHVIDVHAGKKVGEFESGDTPHENNYSADGKLIYHASIGTVYTPADQPAADSTKGDRWLQIVDAASNKVLKRWEVGPLLAAAGYPDMSSAVRPMAISPDERTLYFQVSFFHGFVVFDIPSEKPVKVVDLPVTDKAPPTREQYLLDSAHHGIALNPQGTKLCVAGTMSDYAAIVSTSTFAHKLFEGIGKPYWSTNSGDGKHCWVSASADDKVVVLDYASETKVAEIPVGDHPQRVRMGAIRSEYLGGLPGPSTKPPSARKLAVKVSRKVPRATKVRRTLALRVSSSKRVSSIKASLVRSGKVVARGGLKQLKGKGTLKLRVSKKLKKGTYTLVLSGRNADGKRGVLEVALKFR